MLECNQIDLDVSLTSKDSKAILEKKLLHYTGKAIKDYHMINHNDKILVCLSGGKDSFTMLHLLRLLQLRSKNKFNIFVFTLDQSQPGWSDVALKAYLKSINIEFVIFKKDTYSIVKQKIPEGKAYCSLCSRLRRGIIYQYAKDHGFNKIALGHHRDDLNQTLLMSIFYNGEVKSMPPKLLTDDKQLVVIRPMVYCQEQDIFNFAQLMQFPIVPCNLCGSQANLVRKKIAKLLESLAKENPKIPSNILRAISNVKPSQMMDHELWDFKSF
jgi:tRNA 2-thiocytidine biosynthesis protein TtcA